MLVLFFLVLYVIFGVRFDSIWGAIPLSLLIIGIIACIFNMVKELYNASHKK